MKPRTTHRPTIGWSTSDIDGFVRMYHLGELTHHETEMLRTVLRKLGWAKMLNREHYETTCGPIEL